jgi:phytoene/squalene synthetase
VSIQTSLRRLKLVLGGARVDREHPDLDSLQHQHDPEAFLWQILPHAARTFSACIALLPSHVARAAAVGYLYCRMLDTFEDLHPDPEARKIALQAFAARFDQESMAPPPALPDAIHQDARDATHLLLVERCDMVDKVFATLDNRQRQAVREVVACMAEGMCWSSQTFVDQAGVLNSEQQLLQYCRNVIGYPVVFTLRLMRSDDLPADLTEQAMIVGEMVQLANITRDIEKDLERGIGYHPDLLPMLNGAPKDANVVREVRHGFLQLALTRVPAYLSIVEAIDFDRVSLPRASALLMLLFTDRHYRSCARQVGLSPWPGADSWTAILRQALPAVVSTRYTRRVLSRIERNFLSL